MKMPYKATNVNPQVSIQFSAGNSTDRWNMCKWKKVGPFNVCGEKCRRLAYYAKYSVAGTLRNIRRDHYARACAVFAVIYSVPDLIVKVRFTRSRASFRELSALPY